VKSSSGERARAARPGGRQRLPLPPQGREGVRPPRGGRLRDRGAPRHPGYPALAHRSSTPLPEGRSARFAPEEGARAATEARFRGNRPDLRERGWAGESRAPRKGEGVWRR